MPNEQPRVEVIDQSGDTVVTRAAGDLDILSADQLKQQLADLVDADDGVATLVLDMADVGFVDSSGLGALVAIHRHLDGRGGRFVIRSVPPAVQRLFEITRLDDLLAVDGPAVPGSAVDDLAQVDEATPDQP
jgi:anti-anti-sigma factor